MDAQKFNRLLKKIKYDKSALEVIYNEFSSKLKAYILRRFGKLINPDDVLQEIFLKLLEIDIPNFVEYPTTWLYKIASNCIVDILRRTHPEEELIEEKFAEFEIENTIVNDDVKNALLQLDKESQQILYMHYWEGYRFKEIAISLNLSYSNVRVKASRAYKKLKKYL